MKRWPKRRKKPYTWGGIGRVPCVRCGAPSVHQWQICSDGNNYRGLCAHCDILLNTVVLELLKHPDRKNLLRRYAELAGVE